MTGNNSQEQRSGNDSTNIQAGRDIVVRHGPTIDEVRSIAELTVEANMERVRGVAEQVVLERVEHLREEVISRLAQEPPETIEKGKDPDFQYALLDAEKAYARKGDDEMAALLVDMLVERTRKHSRSLQHLVLGEALTVAPKIMPNLYDILTVIFLLRYVGTTANTFEGFLQFYREFLPPFLGGWPPSFASLQHLEYAGCASIDTVTGYDPITNIVGGATNVFPEKVVPQGVDIRQVLRDAHPSIKQLLDSWQESQVKSASLTSVGIAIAATNLTRKTSMLIDLSIWIN
ncbi:MAG: LPO_1073/Vpar_1526 family protein [Vulcanimicrobiaceae bacterium]